MAVNTARMLPETYFQLVQPILSRVSIPLHRSSPADQQLSPRNGHRTPAQERTVVRYANLHHAKLRPAVLPPEALRGVRGVQVLETIANPEARKVLAVLAGGAAGARLTQEARASLERLAR